ncbi:MAG: diacylglycerol/lipid kinase family protein, partial [Candidatus Limisoma sp.]
LGIIPNGSGNGLARHIGIPLDLQKAAEAFNDSTVEAFDYCTANDRPFFCTCGIGFDAQVSSAFSRRDKRGAAGYIKSALTEYLKYRPETYSLITEAGKITEKAFLIACGNASQYGNNAYITPHADMQDGLIDVTVMLPITPFDTAMIGVLLFSKHIDQDTNIITFRTPDITIERSTSGVMHLDGEAVEMPEQIRIKCHPAGLNICVPPPAKAQSRNIFTSIEAEFWKFIDSVRGELNI